MSIKYLCGLFSTLSAGILTELTRENYVLFFSVAMSHFHIESKNGIPQSIIQP